MQVITKSFQQEWDTYRAEWNAEPLATAAEQHSATLAEALQLAAAADAAGSADDGDYDDLLDDGMRPGGCWPGDHPTKWQLVGADGIIQRHAAVCTRAHNSLHALVAGSTHLPANNARAPVCCCCAAGGYHPVTPGEQFKGGRYTALHFLGQGHYATVWMMWDKSTGQEVAMKVGCSGWVDGQLPGMAGWIGLDAGWWVRWWQAVLP
jgi:hypothetical protein